MGEIIQYIVVHWVEWLFVAISTFLGLCYRQMAKRQKEESRKNAALHDGMQALLRDRIIQPTIIIRTGVTALYMAKKMLSGCMTHTMSWAAMMWQQSLRTNL